MKEKLRSLIEKSNEAYEKYSKENEPPYVTYSCFLVDYLIKKRRDSASC